ncbi:hypothetical protein [Spirillospora sp. NPDC029432]|uniref:WD40 repeat domain-containing protein n=1 Tax=Spirillospora sp. NPDC029432 TaxID=3154599 RepID=UPI0034572772
MLVAGSAGGPVRLDAGTGRPVLEYPDGCYGPISELAAAELPDGRLTLGAAREDGFSAWDAGTGEPLVEPEDLNTVWGLAAGTLANGRGLFAGAGNDHLIHLWDATTGRAFGAPLAGHLGSVKAVATFTLPDGSLGIASGGDDCTVRRWDAASGGQIGDPLTGRDWWFTEVTALELGNGRTMLACSQLSYDEDVRLVHRWDAVTGEPIGPPFETGVEEGGLCTAWIDGAPRLLSCEAGWVRQRGAVTGEPYDDLPLEGDVVAAVPLPGGGTLIATGSRGGRASLTSSRGPGGSGRRGGV